MQPNQITGTRVPGSRIEVGNRLRELEKRFANRAAAAKAAGVAKSTFQNWVEGKADPSFEGLAKFAAAVDVSLDWLAYGAEDTTQHRTSDTEAQPEITIDTEMLSEVIKILEEALQKHNRRLHPHRKALLIAEVYRIMLEYDDDDAPNARAGGHRVWIEGMLKLAT